MWKWIWRIAGPVGALLVTAAGVSPRDAVSNLSAWMQIFGINNPPEIFTSRYADVYAFWIGIFLIVAAVLVFFFRKKLKKGKPPSNLTKDSSIDSIKIKAYINPWDYQENTEIAGIKWQRGFSDMRIIVANTASEDYTNVDLLIQPEIGIAKVGVISAFVRCDSAPDISMQPPTMLMNTMDGDVIAAIPPALHEAEMITPIYRVHCDKFPPQTSFEIVVATVEPNMKPLGTIFSERRRDPCWVDVKISYQAGTERKTESFHLSFNKS